MIEFARYSRSNKDDQPIELFGMEITNNSPETRSIKFLSVNHRHIFDNTGISVRTIIDYKLFMDDNMEILSNYALTNAPEVGGIEIETSLSYGNWHNKVIKFTENWGEGTRVRIYNISEDADLYKMANPNVNVDNQVHYLMTGGFALSRSLQVEITNIKPHEKLLVVFCPKNKFGFEPEQNMRSRIHSILNDPEKTHALILT